MDAFSLLLYTGSFLFFAAAGVFIVKWVDHARDYIRLTNGTLIKGDLVVIWGGATGGSIVGSFLIGLLGVILAIINYPNTQEPGGAFVGGMVGSCLSIPAGIFVGGYAGTVIADKLLRRHGGRPGFIAGAGAFVTAALTSGVSLVPIGLFFFGLGHI